MRGAEPPEKKERYDLAEKVFAQLYNSLNLLVVQLLLLLHLFMLALCKHDARFAVITLHHCIKYKK